MQLPYNFVAAIVVFVLKFSETEASCYWNFGNPGTECLMQCIRSDTTAVIQEIENLWSEKEHCHTNGIWLRLQTLPYPNSTIGSHWFTADVTVFKLEVYLNDVKYVLADAFNSNAFRTVKSLLFENFGLAILENGTFNGLNELEIINIKAAKGINKIEKGVLDALTELKEFTLEQSLKSNPEISISGITGSGYLPQLEYVKIKYNLTNSIKKSTFTGLTNVKRLDLSSCQIKSIEDNSFDPIGETIEELDLSGNSLTTISNGVFNMVLPNIKMISISGNSWHCDCDLISFRLFIEQYEDNFNGYDCASPSECKISNILESDCFTECDIPSTTTSIATTTTTRTTATTPGTNLVMECGTLNTVSIKRPIGYMTISENENGEENLYIKNVKDGISAVVIWFDENQNSGEMIGEEINCISESTSIPIANLKNNVLYSFCLMDSTSTSVSPLDCISYLKRSNQTKSAWLFENSKTLTVILILVSLVLSIVIGIATGLWILTYDPFSKHNNQMDKSSIGSRDSNGFDFNKHDRTSNAYSSNTVLSTATVQHDTNKCPPLPERPSKIFDEPVYASVDEKYWE